MKESGKMSFFAAVLMSINIMVGAGIYYAVGPLSASSGTVSFFGWPLIGLLLFPVIWGVAQAAKLFPGEGGFYHYCSSGINQTAGFMAHWAYLIGFICSAASLATVLRTGLAQNLGLSLLQDHPFIFNAIAVVFYSLLQLLPLGKISKIQSIATLIKITPLFLVIALTAFYFNSQLSFEFQKLMYLGATIPTVIFGYWGFEACCSIGGYLKGGPQKVSSVILVGFLATTSLYLLFHFGLLHIMGAENLATYGAVGFPKFLGLSPIWEAGLQAAILGAILFCWANSILGMSLSNISNIHALAKEGMIVKPQTLLKVNQNDRPVWIVLIHGVLLFLLLTFITDIEILFSVSNLGILLAYFLTLLAAFLTYWKRRNVIQVSVLSLAFFSCAILGYYSWSKLPSLSYTLPLIVWMVAGLIQFKILQAKKRPALSI